MMTTTQDLTAEKIVEYLKENPGIVQKELYPNPGEPKLNEAILHDPNRWEAECMMHGITCPDCFPLRDNLAAEGCGDPSESLMWVFYPNFGSADGEDVPDWPDEIVCRIEDGRIDVNAD